MIKRISAGRRLFIVSDEISERSHRLFDEKDIPAPAISEIIHKLKHYKYVNDLEFAEAYVSTHRKRIAKARQC